jgi:hypothetical protein
MTFIAVRKNKELLSDKYDSILLFLCVIGVNLLFFSTVFLAYGSAIYESRYLLPVFISIVAVFGSFISINNWGKYKYTRAVILFFLIFSLFVSNINSQYSYANTTIMSYNESLPNALAKYEGNLVYGTDPVVTRNMRVLDTSKIYKIITLYNDGMFDFSYLATYKYYEKPGEYQGPTILLISQEQYELLSDYLQARYIFQEHAYGNLNIYWADKNYLNMLE